MLPDDLTGYLAELTERLRGVLDPELLGIYVGGSVALGAYLAGRSDVDVAAVVAGLLPIAQKKAVVDAARHESLPCPARGLELVVYPRTATESAVADPGFEVELNTGAGMPFVANFDPAGAAATHWYAIDRAILAERGRPLLGPPVSELFAPVPPEIALAALVDSLRWHAETEVAPSAEAVLNTCRALRYARERVWSSKPEAAEWARGRTTDDDLVEAAVEARLAGGRLDPARVARFVVAARRELGS